MFLSVICLSDKQSDSSLHVRRKICNYFKIIGISTTQASQRLASCSNLGYVLLKQGNVTLVFTCNWARLAKHGSDGALLYPWPSISLYMTLSCFLQTELFWNFPRHLNKVLSILNAYVISHASSNVPPSSFPRRGILVVTICFPVQSV